MIDIPVSKGKLVGDSIYRWFFRFHVYKLVFVSNGFRLTYWSIERSIWIAIWKYRFVIGFTYKCAI